MARSTCITLILIECLLSTCTAQTPIFPDDFSHAIPLSSNFNPTTNDSWWEAFGGPGTDSFVFSLAEYKGELILGGQFHFAETTPAEGIVRWDGTGWTSLGAGINSGVMALAVWGNELIAGGSFTEAGGVSAYGIAQWDGQEWKALGDGIPRGEVLALAVFNGDLIVAGNFTQAGGIDANCIARWNGTKWSQLGLGTDGNVNDLTIFNGDLIAGGDFEHAGGMPARGVGRMVTRLVDSQLSPGNHTAIWDGTDGCGKPVAAGAYFWRTTIDSWERNQRLILIR